MFGMKSHEIAFPLLHQRNVVSGMCLKLGANERQTMRDIGTSKCKCEEWACEQYEKYYIE